MADTFTRGTFTEAQLEEAIIELFREQGYTYVHGETIHRQFEDILLEDDLRTFLNIRYASAHLTDAEMNRIVSRVNLIPAAPLYDGNKEAFWLINEGFDLTRDDTNSLAVHIDLIDFDYPENNIFKVVNQYSVQDKHLRRPDLLVFINGIPVAICEFKTAIKEDTTVHDAWKQITVRYCRDIPRLMRYCFLSVISDGANTRMGSIFTPYAYYYAWNKANDHERVSDGISSLLTMVKGAFAPDRIVALLRDFVFYPDTSKKSTAIVCRYPQFFAANKMFESIRQHMKPAGDGKGGTYFGATGCGKTYTMLFLARMIALRDNERFHNPTIIVIADREDLDDQTTGLFASAKKFLHDDDVRSIASREDLGKTLLNKPSGGVYITTIQKFCESTGLLSKRENIICISDEAHRTQTGVGSKLVKKDDGIHTTYGFAHYLRESFPNATYCGFTGTPVDETMAVFGNIVDRYTMKESSDDGITVRIAYEPRLARVIVSDEQAKEIQKYYERCAQDGSTPEQIEDSKRAMSKMNAILGHDGRLAKLAEDITTHYEALCAEKPEIVQKAMIVCSSREIAYKLLQKIWKIRPDWKNAHKAADESGLSPEQLNSLVALPKINLVATRNKDDEKGLYDLCGTKEHRKMLDRQFKNNDSNFSIAIVVDMWITGFDVPSLAVMYIDKPLQRHTLIQTISRVNRVFDGKDKGLVVDYIGIKQDMLSAVKQYGNTDENPVDELNVSLGIFRNQLSLLDALMFGFDTRPFYTGQPLERLMCLNHAAEYIQQTKDMQTRFMGLTRRLKAAFAICNPSGELTDEEVIKAQFYLAVRSIIYKQTVGDAPDTEMMNAVVEDMVKRAIACTGVENIVDEQKTIDVFSDEFIEELNKTKMPVTKFNALLMVLKKAINSYGKVNKVKALDFDERLRRVVEKYNERDKLVFTSEVVADFVNDLSDQLIEILRELQKDQESFEQMGISFEEKAFYDILVKVRDDHHFEYADDKCVVLAKEIKKLVDDKAQYADWASRDDIKNQLNMDLTILLYQNGYPPEWDEEVFEKVMEQAENFKRNGN